MKKNNWPQFSIGEAEHVKKILLSNKVNYLFGNEGKSFEKNFSSYTNSKYSLAVANGTLALDLCLRSIGITKGDEVIVTARTFIASASCISILGGIPVFVDVDMNTQNISVDSIMKGISKKTKAIICVHFAGYPCDMPKIMKFAKAKKLLVIEDCAQAHGAMINAKSVGSFGDINAWSFCNDKILTTGGEGGMVTSNRKNLFSKAASFNNHGKNLGKFYKLRSKQLSSFPNLHDNLGLNYRLTEIQSGIGNIQLSKLSRWNHLRNRNANIIIDKVKSLNIVSSPKINKKFIHAFYKLYLVLNPDFIMAGKNRSDIIRQLKKRGVSVSFGASGRIFSEKAFNKFRVAPPSLPNSSQLEKYSLMFEVHPNRTIEEMKDEASIIFNVLSNFQK